MRIGIYLGRHAHEGAGMWVYANSLFYYLVSLLEEKHSNHELILYGDDTICSTELEKSLASLPIFTTEAGVAPDACSSRHFRHPAIYPQRRYFFRKLPVQDNRRFGSLLDQFLMPLFCWLDRLDILHATTNIGFPLAPVPQLITVHDLYQAWPPEVEVSANAVLNAVAKNTEVEEMSTQAPWSFRALKQHLYRLFFKLQSKRSAILITDCKKVSVELEQRFLLNRAAIREIPLGLDQVFLEEFDSACNERSRELLLDGLTIKPGYVLLFASADPRKNLQRSLRVCLRLCAEIRQRGLVIVLSDERARPLVRNILGKEMEAEYVHILERRPRREIPQLLARAQVLLAPTLAEGFGYPAYEARALNVPVVSPKLENLLGYERACLCDPLDELSIGKALQKALAMIKVDRSPKTRRYVSELEREKQEQHLERLAPVPQEIQSNCRTMRDVAREMLSMYEEIFTNRGN